MILPATDGARHICIIPVLSVDGATARYTKVSRKGVSNTDAISDLFPEY